MSYDSIDHLRSQLGAPFAAAVDPVYAAKMLHPLPAGSMVDRATFILERVNGKRVLEFGASGPMHEAAVKVAAFVVGVDRKDLVADGCEAFRYGCHTEYLRLNHASGCVIGFDLDEIQAMCVCNHDCDGGCRGLPELATAPDLILCGEVLEHLSNPGWFLTRLARQYPNVPVLITVPNAFTAAGRGHLARGVENVNIDHVSWYSPRTLRTLLERAGYAIREFAWYGGTPPHSEGLIVVAGAKEA